MSYQQLQSRGQASRQSNQPASTPTLPTFEQIKDFVLTKNVEALIRSAEAWAKNLASDPKPVEPTQMRKFLEEITRIPGCDKPVDIEIDHSLKIESNVKSKLIILRPKFAYTVSRKGNSKLKDFNTQIVDKWLQSNECLSTKIQLEYFHLFIESVVAFHKVHKGNN